MGRPNKAIYYRYCNAEWDGIMEGDRSLVVDDEEEDQGGLQFNHKREVG